MSRLILMHSHLIYIVRIIMRIKFNKIKQIIKNKFKVKKKSKSIILTKVKISR